MLEWGAHPEQSPYSHKQIAEWCDRFWCQYIDIDAPLEIERLLPILTDVETQWDLYLANTYQIHELRSRSFEDEHLPVEWFQDWLSKAKACSMIRFRNPQLRKMQDGTYCIELTEEGTWESFAPFAEAFAQQLGSKITERIDGPDVRLWKLNHGGHDLRLVYEDFPNGVSLEPTDNSQNQVIEAIFQRIRSEASDDGI